MTQTIILRRSAVSGNIPTTIQLSLGEVAINTADGKLFIKRDNGVTETIVEILTNLTGLRLTGGTMTGALTLSGAPTNNLHAATKAYVDSVAGGGSANKQVDEFTSSNFTAGTTNQLTLSQTPTSKSTMMVFQNGVYVHFADFSISGATLTFGSAIPTGVTNIDVHYNY